MTRRSKKPAPKPSSDNDLGLSDLRLRLNFLEKENDKLLKQIETNRTKLNTLNDSINEVTIQVFQRSAPFRQKIMELDGQIHNLFKEIFTGKKLGKKSLKDIQSLYYHLQFDGIISPKFSHMDAEVSAEDNDSDDWHNKWSNHEERSHPQFKQDPPKLDREELKKIRQIFLRLADSFHPDKVTDESEKEYCTEVMKEINLAYKNGDLARLLAIEKQQELGEIINRFSSDDLTRHCTKVEAENSFLKDQLDNLKLQIKLTNKSQQGEMTAAFKRMIKYGMDPLEDAVREIEAELLVIETLQKFIVDFRDRRITIKEFLKGPTAILQKEEMSEEEFVLEMLAKFM